MEVSLCHGGGLVVERSLRRRGQVEEGGKGGRGALDLDIFIVAAATTVRQH